MLSLKNYLSMPASEQLEVISPGTDAVAGMAIMPLLDL